MEKRKGTEKLISYLTDKGYRFKVNSKLGLHNRMPDEKYLKKLYYFSLGKELNLQDPVAYNEKIQWLKLYDHRDIYVTFVDKYEVKKYVSSIIGEDYIIPTLEVYDSFEEIDFDKLPSQFVLKCTHDSGGVVICKDKSTFDRVKAKRIINQCLKKNFYYTSREWPYKKIRPRIIAEQYLEDSVYHELRDYKFFCFDGIPKAFFIASARQAQGEETKFDFYDMGLNHLDLKNGHPMAAVTPLPPRQFDEMKKLAARLSAGYPHLRVDFYEVNGKVYFGELTLYHWSGIVPFEPEEWDEIFGSWIKLPPKESGNCKRG